MNETISQYLGKYMVNPDPRYAVMIKGKWGCGKSFFIQNWIKHYKEKFNNGEVVLEPIYVSLYGLKYTSEITSAIDRVLHPFFYSKGVDITKKILNLAGKIVFKTSFDLNNDSNTDLSMNATLDSLSLLTSNETDSIVGPKLIVFDDFERCLINMKLLLGYINNFVEHGACHVIIIGDETHVQDAMKHYLSDFKEKTIGREFEIVPDIDTAFDYFITNDIPLTKWLSDKKTFILDCFRSTKCNNLRLLRQCLYDFSVIYNEIDVFLVQKNDAFMTSFLGTYIIIFCEYKGENKDLLENWDDNYISAISVDKTIRTKIRKLENKYLTISNKYNIRVFDKSHIKQITREIGTGYNLKYYIEKNIIQEQNKFVFLEKLSDFIQLSNEEFKQMYDELESSIKNNKITDLFLMGKALSMLVFFEKKKIHPISKDTISSAKEYITKAFSSIDNKDNLHQSNNLFQKGVNSFFRFYGTSLNIGVFDYVNKIFEKRNSELKNKMEELLLNLDNDNVERLIELSGESTPDHQCNYSMTSIFKNIDANIFSDKILSLNNKSLKELCQFFYQHYEFNCNLSIGCNHYSEDLSVLQNVVEKLKKELQRREMVDLYMLKNLIKYICGAIKRAEGNNDPIEIDDY